MDRQVLYERFYLFDALPNLQDYFQVQRQTAILFEPGFAWDFANSESLLNPLLSFKISQLGYVDHKIKSAPLNPMIDMGISIAPSIFSKNVEVAVNYRTNSNKEFADNLSLASSLSFSWVQIYMGLENEVKSVGLSSRFRNWSSGIILQRQKSIVEKSDRDISLLEFRILI